MPSRREFLAAGLAMGVTALFPPGSANASPANGSVFRAGAGRAEVVFSADLFPLDGFAAQHDPLAV